MSKTSARFGGNFSVESHEERLAGDCGSLAPLGWGLRDLETWSFMYNIWYDFDFGDSPIRPFVGGGIGFAHASLDFDINENWSVGVWGHNLTDEVYRGMRGVSFLGIPFSLYMQPRTYGVEGAYRF